MTVPGFAQPPTNTSPFSGLRHSYTRFARLRRERPPWPQDGGRAARRSIRTESAIQRMPRAGWPTMLAE